MNKFHIFLIVLIATAAAQRCLPEACPMKCCRSPDFCGTSIEDCTEFGTCLIDSDCPSSKLSCQNGNCVLGYIQSFMTPNVTTTLRSSNSTIATSTHSHSNISINHKIANASTGTIRPHVPAVPPQYPFNQSGSISNVSTWNNQIFQNVTNYSSSNITNGTIGLPPFQFNLTYSSTSRNNTFPNSTIFTTTTTTRSNQGFYVVNVSTITNSSNLTQENNNSRNSSHVPAINSTKTRFVYNYSNDANVNNNSRFNNHSTNVTKSLSNNTASKNFSRLFPTWKYDPSTQTFRWSYIDQDTNESFLNSTRVSTNNKTNSSHNFVYYNESEIPNRKIVKAHGNFSFNPRAATHRSRVGCIFLKLFFGIAFIGLLIGCCCFACRRARRQRHVQGGNQCVHQEQQVQRGYCQGSRNSDQYNHPERVQELQAFKGADPRVPQPIQYAPSYHPQTAFQPTGYPYQMMTTSQNINYSTEFYQDTQQAPSLPRGIPSHLPVAFNGQKPVILPQQLPNSHPQFNVYTLQQRPVYYLPVTQQVPTAQFMTQRYPVFVPPQNNQPQGTQTNRINLEF